VRSRYRETARFGHNHVWLRLDLAREAQPQSLEPPEPDSEETAEPPEPPDQAPSPDPP
jgi:hypothetical protein